jgi:hypothetical protein
MPTARQWEASHRDLPHSMTPPTSAVFIFNDRVEDCKRTTPAEWSRLAEFTKLPSIFNSTRVTVTPERPDLTGPRGATGPPRQSQRLSVSRCVRPDRLIQSRHVSRGERPRFPTLPGKLTEGNCHRRHAFDASRRSHERFLAFPRRQT